MNSEQHYAEAEKELDRAHQSELGDESDYHLAKAQVHATLATIRPADAPTVKRNDPVANREADREAAKLLASLGGVASDGLDIERLMSRTHFAGPIIAARARAAASDDNRGHVESAIVRLGLDATR